MKRRRIKSDHTARLQGIRRNWVWCRGHHDQWHPDVQFVLDWIAVRNMHSAEFRRGKRLRRSRRGHARVTRPHDRWVPLHWGGGHEPIKAGT